METSELKTIRMFWHGAPFSRLERLAIQSFLHHGHSVELYLYEPQPRVPLGTIIRDASGILPASLMFRHRRTHSLAPFADWFRYRLLLERGGIWADLDVVCLAPFDFQDDVIFGRESATQINNAVLGLPAGHPLAQLMSTACEFPNRAGPFDDWQARLRKGFRRHLQGDRRDNVRWGEFGPKGLTRAVRHLALESHARPVSDFYPVAAKDWQRLFQPVPSGESTPWPAESRAVHFWNNQLARAGAARLRHELAADSPFEKLCRRYGVDD